ncbi:MAG: tetratricopeptide repeat protein [Hyphomicrobiaceae bacterium]
MNGDVAAQVGWAHVLLNGYGTARDPDAAFRWFRLAARSGNADAINMIGRCHELGWGTAQNIRLAEQAYCLAVKKGHAWGCFNLAMLMLARGETDQRRREILSLLVRAARRGITPAISFIGQACEEGWCGLPRPGTARRWYARAARRGCYRGKFNLARQNMSEGDVDGAIRWLERAVKAGPPNFNIELGAYLAAHPDQRLREIAALALEQAELHPPRSEQWSAMGQASVVPSERTTAPSILEGRRNNICRVLRKLTGVVRLSRM